MWSRKDFEELKDLFYEDDYTYEDYVRDVLEGQRLEALKTPEQRAKEQEEKFQKSLAKWAKSREEKEDNWYFDYYEYEDGVGEDEMIRDAINNRLDD